ncbi:hypothetical protein LSUE1_G003821 [Lachnellula suecica]|uniref:Uncharacterized protein n=1 Tax=Lachnellula suecica TaxID=602035 RepID=A0A8T9CEB8_9HELO|nr:hypothetical protein LSUE1_G003821 [Lachnellula suecica]
MPGVIIERHNIVYCLLASLPIAFHKCHPSSLSIQKSAKFLTNATTTRKQPSWRTPPPSRFRSSILLAFGLRTLYLIFWTDVLTLDYGGHAVDVLTGGWGGVESVGDHAQNLEGSAEGMPTPDAVPRPTSSRMKPGTEKHPTQSLPRKYVPGYVRPYPKYNTKVWKAANKGRFHLCDGPFGPIQDIEAFSGHPSKIRDPLVGSYVPLDIDSNSCFERETRLGIYEYSGEEIMKAIDWGALQKKCAYLNSDRFIQNISNSTEIRSSKGTRDVSNSTSKTIEDEAEGRKQGLHGMPTFAAKSKSRTATLIRVNSGQKYTENGKQNIRSLITELSLKNGAEYQIWLLVYVKDAGLPAHNSAITTKHFLSFRPVFIKTEKATGSPVQKSSQDYPEYDFIWNWEFDVRYTGHHYNLLEKLAAFAYVQSRRKLWERNERFNIRKYHGPYNTVFRKSVRKLTGSDAIWGAPSTNGIKAIGTVRP